MADAAVQPEADGYYGEGDMGDQEVDMSFLDNESKDSTADKAQ